MRENGCFTSPYEAGEALSSSFHENRTASWGGATMTSFRGLMTVKERMQNNMINNERKEPE
jgi:hypothetical protein